MARLPKYDIVSIDDLSTAEIEHIFALADSFAEKLARGETIESARGLIMATLFYEPSTRTRLSFESAMNRLGGSVISSADMHASSAAKGETLADTVRVVSAYADLLVVRHPNDGAARVAAEYASIPIINAGDGSREHPTQTLCDLYILRRKKGRLQGLTVAICGDLKFGRTVHSLIYALARFGANIVTVPYGGMDVPDYVLERVAAERNYALSTVTIDELKSQAGALDALYLTPSAPHQMALFTGNNPLERVPAARPPAALDAFYVTRLQKERLAEKDRADAAYVHFDARALRSIRTQEAVVMHPLPRTDELAYELDSDPRAVYFEQAAAGVPVRMALIAWMMEGAARDTRPASASPLISFKHAAPPRCSSAACITRHETAYLVPRFRLGRSVNRSTLALRCEFCERELAVEYVGHATSRRFYRFDEHLYGYVRQWIEEGSLAVFENLKEAEERGYEPYKRGPQREIMDAAEIERSCEEMATQVLAGSGDPAALAIVGVVSRGALLGLRMRNLIEKASGVRPACAAVDVYADDVALHSIDDSRVDFSVDGREVILVDDVINSGWTIQRAMTALWRHGRPASVKLAVLIDRGHRALPIKPNFIGKNIPSARGDRVQVRIGGDDRKAADRVVLYSMVEPMATGGAIE
ncbi:MAG TPA: bifunctional pyr operon transcriptional regulator/uracil phosphoribosyltransferase PyrR [Candidatus Binataceae bacterium]|nr:bifunctional pyr operon transcriptional regulator/uracil phosphoribosyltransferase PyrR [Candidatus Binataceae bacterium]